MGLDYNTDTAVYRQDPGYSDKITTANQTGQELFGNTVAGQTNKWSFQAGTSNGVYTEILAQDIILTQFAYTIRTGAGAASQRTVGFRADIDGVEFSADSGTTGVAGQIVCFNSIPIPNWRLPAGTVIEVEISGTGSPQGNIMFVGYLA